MEAIIRTIVPESRTLHITKIHYKVILSDSVPLQKREDRQYKSSYEWNQIKSNGMESNG